MTVETTVSTIDTSDVNTPVITWQCLLGFVALGSFPVGFGPGFRPGLGFGFRPGLGLGFPLLSGSWPPMKET